MNDLATVGEKTVEILKYQGEPVITLRMMDELHERPDGTAGRNFRQHRGRLEKGVDYFEVQSTELPTNFVDNPQGGRPSTILLAESGYLLLVKSFQDHRAWEVQRALVWHYFRSKSLRTPSQLADYAPIARIVTEGLLPVFEKVEQRQSGVEKELGHLRVEVHEVHDEVRELRSEVVRKRAPTAKTRRRHLNALEKFGGKCPCCGFRQVVDAFGNKLDGAEWEHYFAPNRAAVTETWLTCKQCNKDLRGYGQFWRNARPQFDAYQAKREVYEQHKQPYLPFGE